MGEKKEKEVFRFACYECFHEHSIEVNKTLHLFHICEGCGKTIDLRKESEYSYYLELRKKVLTGKYNKLKLEKFYAL